MSTTYADFLAQKTQLPGGNGFEPLWLPDCLFDFQRHLVEWAVRRGRAAIFADCGLGKSPMALVWAENVVRHTAQPVLLLTPLGVAHQFLREAAKFGVAAARSTDGTVPAGARVVVANYERLHHFRPDDFAGAVCDESSILKNFDGKHKAQVVEFLRTLPYRLLCTATAAPNDFVELGNSSEALGEMGFQDMVSRFFHKETQKDYLGWGRTSYRMRGHAARDFWRWVCSWARACRKPSDLGCDDGPFLLPELVLNEHTVEAATPAPGFLFEVPAVTLQEQRQEQRRTLRERCERAAALAMAHDRPAVCWCHLNDEGDLLERLIPGAVQVAGRDSDDAKERKLLDFAEGRTRVLVTKPELAGFGLNWQHCAHQTCFPSHSFERWYQGVRRSWRFGQTRPVVVDVIATKGSAGVLANLRRKAAQVEEMFSALVRMMNDSLRLDRGGYGDRKEEVPAWL